MIRHCLYLRQTFHQVGVSCLISELGSMTIAGHQRAGGVTNHAVQDLLRLPILPKQIISLLDLGGPSFALSNHWDHIHVGY
jgi:hypothetical protein